MGTAWTLTDIHKVCSWCDRVLHEGDPECRVTTHGICPPCKRKMLEESPPPGCWICEMCSNIVTNPGSPVCEDCENHWGPFTTTTES